MNLSVCLSELNPGPSHGSPLRYRCDTHGTCRLPAWRADIRLGVLQCNLTVKSRILCGTVYWDIECSAYIVQCQQIDALAIMRRYLNKTKRKFISASRKISMQTLKNSVDVFRLSRWVAMQRKYT